MVALFWKFFILQMIAPGIILFVIDGKEE